MPIANPNGTWINASGTDKRPPMINDSTRQTDAKSAEAFQGYFALYQAIGNARIKVLTILKTGTYTEIASRTVNTAAIIAPFVSCRVC